MENSLEKNFDWRNEVASRVNSYQVRRKLPPRERSMRLNFDPLPQEPAVDLVWEPAVRNSAFLQSRPVHIPAALRNIPPEPAPFEPQSVLEQLPVAMEESSPLAVLENTVLENEVPEVAVLENIALEEVPEENQTAGPPFTLQEAQNYPSTPEDNILHFPRPAVYPAYYEELAEPVLDRPRILDVPEGLQLNLTPLSDIGLGACEDADARQRLEIEVPLQVASFGSRALAAAVDLVVTMAAAAVFAVVVLQWPVQLPATRLGAALAPAVVCVLWAAYQYIFLVYAGTTLGMQALGLRLKSFESGPVDRNRRRWRALGILCSSLPLGLGLAWAFFDEDSLCWHDRISHSYVTRLS